MESGEPGTYPGPAHPFPGDVDAFCLAIKSLFDQNLAAFVRFNCAISLIETGKIVWRTPESALLPWEHEHCS